MPGVPVVIDASVALKWLFQEQGRPKALQLLNSYQLDDLELRAPELLISEVGNIITLRVWKGMLDKPDTPVVFELFLNMAPKLYPGSLFATDTLGIAVRYRRTFYDSLYLACAVRWNCELITADEKFFNAMSSDYPHVRLLADV
jgi:predicted nucleic acid-binding protein